MNHQEAREELVEAVADIKYTALRVDGHLWSEVGTPDLTLALEDLRRSTAPDEQEGMARRVSEAFVVHPGQLYAHGIDNLSFGTAILSLRLALAHLDAVQRPE
ncbi:MULTISPECIES: hypothetical protein [Streptomyces]|uniref:hypothetical protein n=1 Tax=Streptomyces TaxID=1883 RepID=UPI0022572B72|nr:MULTISPECIES: hypothetical protein [unclassified Streptomyces]MCX5267423.1 hypothetical protein [Streptomyces sp. NBC_00199]